MNKGQPTFNMWTKPMFMIECLLCGEGKACNTSEEAQRWKSAHTNKHAFEEPK